MKLKNCCIKVLKIYVIGLSITNSVSILAMIKLSLYFATKFKIKKVRKVNIRYRDIQIKQYSEVKYLTGMDKEGGFVG